MGANDECDAKAIAGRVKDPIYACDNANTSGNRRRRRSGNHSCSWSDRHTKSKGPHEGDATTVMVAAIMAGARGRWGTWYRAGSRAAHHDEHDIPWIEPLTDVRLCRVSPSEDVTTEESTSASSSLPAAEKQSN